VSITRYCGWVSPSGSSSGRYTASTAVGDRQRETHLALEGQRINIFNDGFTDSPTGTPHLIGC
jgi:hypothetical protein